MKLTDRIRPWPRRTVVLITAISGLLVAGLIAALALSVLPSTNESAAIPIEQPAQPDTAFVVATFAAWPQEGDQSTRFSAEAGATRDGGIALRIDSVADPAGESRSALRQVVAVESSTKYTLSALTAGAQLNSKSSGVALIVGSTTPEQFDFPAAKDAWTTTTWTYTTGASETELSIALTATGEAAGYRIDTLTLSAEGAADLLENGSFENYSAPTQITNDSLILKSGQASLGLAWRTPNVTWSISDEQGTVLTKGDLPLTNGLGLIPLKDLNQGYYNASLTSSDGSIPAQQISFIILDDPSSPSSSDNRFGIGVHINEPRYDNSEVEAAQLGFRHARTDAYWSESEKLPGEYDFPADEDVKTQAFKAAGIDMLPISVYSNPMYDGGKTPSSPVGIQAYSNYTSAIMDHFNPGSIEIYNEFNWHLNNGDCGATAACYLGLLQPAVDKVKTAYPGTTIVGPSTAHMDDAFMTELYQAGGLNYLDAVSFHPYDELNIGAETLLPILTQANARMKEYNNGQTKPIWLTEMGWTSGKVGESNQANFLARSQTIAFANGVERFYWYDLVNDNLDITDGEGNFGLLRQFSESVPAFAPKPAAMAQAMLARKIADKAYASQDALDDTAFSYAFGSGASVTRVAWATAPTTVSYATKKPVAVTTQYGKTSLLKPVDGRISISLSDQVVYLDGLLSDAAVTTP
jgi:hypothetical protein